MLIYLLLIANLILGVSAIVMIFGLWVILVKNQEESIAMANEQEQRLNTVLESLGTSVALIISLLQELVAANPDLTDEIAKVETLVTAINTAIEEARGGGEVPEPPGVPGDETPTDPAPGDETPTDPAPGEGDPAPGGEPTDPPTGGEGDTQS